MFIPSRFLAVLSLFAVVSTTAARFLEDEEADPCVDGTEAIFETDAYANATAILYMALDEFEGNASGICVMVDERTECKGALPEEVTSTFEASCTAMEGIVISASNMRITCNFPDKGNTYTVLESFPDCVSPVCDEDGQKDLKKDLLKTVDKYREGNQTLCFTVDGDSAAVSVFSVSAVVMSLAAAMMWVL